MSFRHITNHRHFVFNFKTMPNHRPRTETEILRPVDTLALFMPL